MSTRVFNIDGKANSLQVSRMGKIPVGNFKLTTGDPFLIKNVTDANITIEIKPAGNAEKISTVLYPGWNPELCVEVIGTTADQLQYGY